MSLLGKAWRFVKNWWHGTDAKHDVFIDQNPIEKVVIGLGGSTKLSANVTTLSHESFIKWQKVEGNKSINIRTDSIKYSGSSCSMPTPELVINDVDKTDDGVYHLTVTTVTGIVTGPKVLLSVFGDPVMSLPKEERNFLRYYLLCQTIATESVRLYFTRKVPELTLSTHLNTHKSNLQSSYWKCTNDQLTILFPVSPGNAKSSNFDFSLLYKLIRNTIIPASTPTHGWGRKPLPCDTKEEDDIERIRQSRNTVAHNTEFKLNDSDFNNLWTDLSQATVRLSYGALSGDVIKLSKQNLDQQLKNEVFENLKTVIEILKGEVSIIQQDMEEYRERIQTIEDTHIPPNIRGTQIQRLKVWKTDDEVFYDATNVYQATKDKVEACSIVALVGGPGCGKTATARHLALSYERNGWEIVPVFRIEEILQYADVTYKQTFLLDDIFGIFSVDMFMYHNVKHHREGIMNAIGQDSKLILTCRRSVYNEALKFKSFVLDHIVDLESGENILNECEKGKILAKHCRYNGVSENIYCNISLSSSFTMFPLICKLFSTTHENHVSVDNFFANPFECIIDELKNLEHRTPLHYAALVTCVLSNNMLSIKKIIGKEKEMKLDAYNTCGVNLGTSDREITNALSYMVGTYLKINENIFNFIHDSIYEIVAYHYGKTNPQMILRYMNSNFIATKVRVHKDQEIDISSSLSIVINEEHYKQMAERLYIDVKSLELFDVFKNQSLFYRPFLDIFIRVLRQKPYEDLQALLFHIKLNPPRVISRHIDNDRHKETQHDYDEYRRQELLLNYVFESFNDDICNVSYSIRAISWIIYYGHTYLLQSIIDLVLELNDSTKMIFGSDILEQTRLMTLGCYSGNHEIVETILKHVDNDCVHKTSLKENHKRFNRHRSYTPLTAACDSGYLSVVQILLRNNANIDQFDDNDHFPLLIASLKGYNKVVEYLVDNGANVNQCDRKDKSSLYNASKEGHYDVVKYLLLNGANVNQNNKNRKSSLYKASEGGHFEVTKYLILNGANLNKCDRKDKSPLYKASKEGHYDVVKYLVLNGANVNQNNKNIKSSLYKASEGGYFDIVRYLVLHGANVNQCDEYEESPLYKATEGGYYDIVKHLLQNGSDVNHCNNANVSPLQLASQEEHYNVVKCLVMNGAMINQCTEINKSALFTALEKGNFDIVKYLIQNGANINHCFCGKCYTLQFASNAGYYEIVKYLVQNGAEVNKCCKGYECPLCKASARGHTHIVEYLVQNGADVSHCDMRKESPLYKASAEGHIDIVECLIQNGADVNLCNKDRISPLCHASFRGYYDVVRYLVLKGANVNQCNKYNDSPLCIGSGGTKYLFEKWKIRKVLQDGYFDIVKCLVQNGADVNHCNEDSMSPLYRASEEGRTSIVEYLIQNGADVNKCDIDEKSPLYQASQGGHYEVVKYLVQNGANVNYCDKDNQSPLYRASEGGHYKVVKHLVQNGANVNTCNISNESPLFRASAEGHCGLAKLLVDKGAKVHQCSSDINSLLNCISCQGTYRVVKYLVEKGANVNQCNKDYNSPLNCALIRGCNCVVKYLVRNGANVNQPDNENYYPLHFALFSGNTKVVKYLVQNGANVNQCDIMNKTLLYHAVEMGNSDLVKFLIKYNASLTIKSNDGISPLQLAMWMNFLDIATDLMRAENQTSRLSGNHHLLHILQKINATKVSVFAGSGHVGVGLKRKKSLSNGLLEFIILKKYELLQHLLKLGLNANRRNYDGHALLNIIIETLQVEERYKKVELLLQNGADPLVRDDHSLSTLEKTRQLIEKNEMQSNEYTDIFILLRKHMRRNSV